MGDLNCLPQADGDAMLCGSAANGDDGASADELPSNAEMQELFLPRGKKSTDAVLQKCLQDGYVLECFRGFLMGVFAEEILTIWQDVSSYELIPFESERKRELAQTIYDKYFKESGSLSLRSIGIDRETKEGVKITLKVDNNDIVQQADPKALEKVFHLVHAKIFNILKFEHLPMFLISKEFVSLKTFTDFFDSHVEAAQASSNVLASMTMRDVLDLPYFSACFLSFVNDNEFRGERDGNMKGAGDLYDLYQEIKDHQRSSAAGESSHSFQRLVRIFARFGNTKNTTMRPLISELEDGFKKLEKKPGAFKECGSEFFSGVLNEVLNRLTEMCLGEFKKSNNFIRLLTGLSDRKGGLRARKKSESKIREMESLGGNASVGSKSLSLADMKAKFNTLSNVLGVSTGIFYVKRFARLRLQEERVSFWIEVELFRKGGTLHDVEGSAEMDANHVGGYAYGSPDPAMMREFAERIYSLYVSEDGAHSLKGALASSTRSALAAIVEGDSEMPCQLDMFRNAQREVLNTLEKGLWVAFRNSSAYENFVKRCLRGHGARKRYESNVDVKLLAKLLEADATSIGALGPQDVRIEE